MGELCQRREISLTLLLILYGTADVHSSLPVDIASEEKGKIIFLTGNVLSLCWTYSIIDF